MSKLKLSNTYLNAVLQEITTNINQVVKQVDLCIEAKRSQLRNLTEESVVKVKAKFNVVSGWQSEDFYVTMNILDEDAAEKCAPPKLVKEMKKLTSNLSSLLLAKSELTNLRKSHCIKELVEQHIRLHYETIPSVSDACSSYSQFNQVSSILEAVTQTMEENK